MIDSFPSLVSFLKHFHRHWLDDPSLDSTLIPADLPDGLGMLYRELGALVEIEQERAPFSSQDALMPLSKLKRVEGMVEFAWENQGNWSARCPVGIADPPVYSNALDVWKDPQQGFVAVCESLNHFLTTLCLQEAVMSCRNLVALRTVLAPDKVLGIEMRPLWLNGWYVAGEASHQFYSSPDGEVLIMDWAGIWIGSSVHPVGELVATGINSHLLHGA